MTDVHFTRLDQYRDLESLNAYHQRVEEASAVRGIDDGRARRPRP